MVNQQQICSHTAYRSKAFFGGLDGLRCLSILAVIWHHTGIRVEGLPISHFGFLGVDLFFSISGFLITTLLLREKDRYGIISLKAFYVRRSLRIFPLYYSVIAIYVFAVLAKEGGTLAGREFFGNLPYFLTYTSNWFVHLDGRVIFYFAWSLATEEQFYLIWPTIEKYCREWQAPIFAVFILLIREFANFAINAGLLSNDNLAIVILLSIHPAILGGVLLAHVLHHRNSFEFIKLALASKPAALLTLAGLLATVGLGLPIECVWVLMVLLVGSTAINESNGLAKVLRWRPIAHIGMISYGIYLMHMLVVHSIKSVLGSFSLEVGWLLFPATVFVTTLAATISYRYYESWFLRLKEKYSRLQTRPAIKLNPE